MTIIEGPSADIREMYMAHTMFRREFAQLPALVRGVGAGDGERAQLVAGHLGFVTNVLHHHHQAEDTHLWPKLLERGPEELDPVVHLMESQHADIDQGLTGIRTASAAWQDGAAVEHGTELAEALDRLLPLLDEHLRVEEESLLPLIEKYVTAAEWDEMTREAAGDTPQEQLPLILGMMMYEGDPAVIEKVLSQMPADVRPMVEGAAHQAFTDHAERVYGTATPPRSAD